MWSVNERWCDGAGSMTKRGAGVCASAATTDEAWAVVTERRGNGQGGGCEAIGFCNREDAEGGGGGGGEVNLFWKRTEVGRGGGG